MKAARIPLCGNDRQEHLPSVVVEKGGKVEVDRNTFSAQLSEDPYERVIPVLCLREEMCS